MLIGACWLALSLGLATSAAAQGHGGIANSGMTQGEARITSRSDVRLSMESLPGTGRAAVTALGQRVGARMAQIRGCYGQRVELDPTIIGLLRFRFLLEGRGRPRIEIDRDAVEDAELVRCLTRVLEGLDVSGLTRPTRAVIVLQLANTAARGAAEAAERAQRGREVVVTTDPAGNPTSSGGTPDGHVRFTVTGRGARSAPAVAAAHRALLTAIPGLMDCRRRAGRQGRSPGGDLSATMQLRAGHPPVSRVTRSTVPNERTRGCVSRVLDRIQHRENEGQGRVRVDIHFEPAAEIGAGP